MDYFFKNIFYGRNISFMDYFKIAFFWCFFELFYKIHYGLEDIFFINDLLINMLSV